jgi:hypothetical protein
MGLPFISKTLTSAVDYGCTTAAACLTSVSLLTTRKAAAQSNQDLSTVIAVTAVTVSALGRLTFSN